MTLNIDNFISMHKFSFQAEKLGKVLCHNFSMSAMMKAQKWPVENEDKSAEDFARFLTTIICQIDSDGDSNYTDDRITESQSNDLTNKDLEQFSCLFIEKNSYLLEDQEKKETVRSKNDKDKTVISFKKYPSENLKKVDDESNCEHLFRVIQEYIKQSNKRNKKIFDDVTKNLFSTSTLDLLNENRRISESLGNMLHEQKPMTFPELPENPIYETNRNLIAFGQEFKEVASLIKNMNDLGVRMAIDSSDSSARNRFWNNIMFGLGLAAILVTAIVAYVSYISSEQSSNELTRLLTEQNTKFEVQINTQQKIIELLSRLPTMAQQSVDEQSQLNINLAEIAKELKNITSKFDSQPKAAKTQ